jgi:hypothetical protein
MPKDNALEILYGGQTMKKLIKTGISSLMLAVFIITVLAACPNPAGGEDQLEAPSGLSVWPLTADSLMVGWTPVTGAEYYKVYRSQDPDWKDFILLNASINKITTYTANGLSPDTEYYFKVSAYAGTETAPKQESEMSKSIGGITTSFGPPSTIMVKALSTDSIVIEWSKVAGAAAYKVYGSVNTGVNYTEIATLGETETSYTHTGLTSATTYYYRISALKGTLESRLPSGNNNYSTTTLPEPPATLSAHAHPSGDAITVAWDPVAGAASYRLYCSLVNDTGPYAFMAAVSQGTSYIMNRINTVSLSPGTYYFKVAAVTSGGEGSMSPQFASATIP